VLGGAIVASIADQAEAVEITPAIVSSILDLVTTPRPFLRWDPVIELPCDVQSVSVRRIDQRAALARPTAMSMISSS
jgi:hypothetical protein